MLFITIFTILVASLTAKPLGQHVVSANSLLDEKRIFLISLDGLRFDYVERADELGIKIPNIKWLMENGIGINEDAMIIGAHSRMKSVYPAVTFPAHVSMITGVHPSTHGILNNQKFDPLKIGKGLFMFAEDVKSETIFDAGKSKGMSTSAISWPVTAFSQTIDFSLPDAPIGSPTELDYYYNSCIKSDAFKSIIVDRKKLLNFSDYYRLSLQLALFGSSLPRINALHLVEFDHFEHVYGAFSPEAISMLEQEDKYIGELVDSIRKHDLEDSSYIFLVSDHGFTNISKIISPAVLLSSSGLMQSPMWKAAPYIAPGICAIYVNDELHESEKNEVKRVVDGIVKYLYTQQGDMGISKIIVGEDNVANAQLKGFHGAYAILESKPGYWFSDQREGLLFEEKTIPGYLGTHGYNPEISEMDATFIAVGPTIKRNYRVENVSMVDIAPTISQLLSLGMKKVEGVCLDNIFH